MRGAELMLGDYVCLDFEASGLSARSYPIEAGLCDTVTGAIWSRLIKPTEGWLEAGEWADEAEAMTGITKTMLEAGGDPADVLRDLLLVVGGRAIVSDALDYDGVWMQALAEAAGRPGDCPPLVGLGSVCGKLALWRGPRAGGGMS